jgi:hypothetical protein
MRGLIEQKLTGNKSHLDLTNRREGGVKVKVDGFYLIVK